MKHILGAIAGLVLALGAGLGEASAQTFRPGQWVVARWQAADPYWYPAVVVSEQNGGVVLKYDDGDSGQQPLANVRPYDWGAGTRIYCRWRGGRVYYPGKITTMQGDRIRFDVHYDDGDRESTNSTLCRSN